MAEEEVEDNLLEEVVSSRQKRRLAKRDAARVKILKLKWELEREKKKKERELAQKDKKIAVRDQKVKKLRGHNWQKTKTMYRISQEQVQDAAKEIVYEKLRRVIVGNANFIDGVAALPILLRKATELGLNLTQMSVFILINHFKWFTTADGKYWGYTQDQVYKSVTVLREMELVEAFEGKNKAYVVSIKGKSVYRSFQRFYTKAINEFFENMDKDFEKRSNRPILYRKKKKEDGKAES